MISSSQHLPFLLLFEILVSQGTVVIEYNFESRSSQCILIIHLLSTNILDIEDTAELYEQASLSSCCSHSNEGDHTR